MSSLEHNQGELPKRLEKAAINELPLIRVHGTIHMAEDSKSFKRYATRLAKQTILGFDIECKPNFKRGPNNPPALVQFSTADQAFLFRLYPTMKLGPLIKILENPEIIKTGVAIKDDIYNLKKIEEFEPGGFEDLAPWPSPWKLSRPVCATSPPFSFPTVFPNPPSFPTGKNPPSRRLSFCMRRRMHGSVGSST